jgi:DNA-binding CsgD family transcriptional regulator
LRKVIVTTGALIAQGAASGLVSETLTARERDILAMIGQGLSNKRIARAREISPETVKSHVKHIFLKLAVSSRAQAVYQAESLGLLRGGNPRQEEGRRSAVAVSRSNFLAVAAILSSAIVANGYAGPVLADLLFVGARSPATVYSPSPERTLLAQASGEDTVA